MRLGLKYTIKRLQGYLGEVMDTYRLRKKYALTWAVFLGGTAIGWHTGADLGAYTAFSTLILSVFAVSDVVDKKINSK